MSKIQPLEDQLATNAANEIIAMINGGEIDVSKYLIALGAPKDHAQEVFYEYLNECIIDEINPSEFIQKKAGIVCSNERLDRIVQKNEKIDFCEISDWLCDLYNRGYHSGMNEYYLIPAALLGRSNYFLIIRRDGTDLEPDYDAVAAFASESDAREYFAANYDY